MKHLIEKVIEFREKRDWNQYHTPRNLAMSVSIEAAELLELFQWNGTAPRQELADEIADVFIYLLTLCHETGVDPETAILAKIKKNGVKYPEK